MAIRNIRKDEDPILRKKSKVVMEIDERVLTLLDDMADTMYDAEGVGLAAPQVGVLKRVIVVDIGYGLFEVINPEIVEEEGEQIGEEGCLSLPGKNGDVCRPRKITVAGLNRKGEKIRIQGEDLMARALCHEIDHLNGVLFTDLIVEEEE